MTIARATTFGRRGPKATRAPRAPMLQSTDGHAIQPKHADERFMAMAREMLRSEEEERDFLAAQGKVPWSLLAAMLAGFAGSCLQAGLYVVAAKGSIEIIPGLKMSLGTGPQMLMMAVAYGLWNGAQIATAAIMISHAAMRFVQISSPIGYGIAGALSGAFYAYGMQLLTQVPQNIFATAASGLAAGFLYRLIAGVGRR